MPEIQAESDASSGRTLFDNGDELENVDVFGDEVWQALSRLGETLHCFESLYLTVAARGPEPVKNSGTG